MGLCLTNGPPIPHQKTRKEESFNQGDFAVPVNNRLKINENEKSEKYLYSSISLKSLGT